MAGRDAKALTLPQLTDVDPVGSSSSRDTCGWVSARPGTALDGLVGCCWTPVDGACVLSTRCVEGNARDGGDATGKLDLV
ncbi:hypothetical protein CP533_3302, partial [Ophiocordyceps camponoti-saundersi (nom. inval.)]